MLTAPHRSHLSLTTPRVQSAKARQPGRRQMDGPPPATRQPRIPQCRGLARCASLQEPSPQLRTSSGAPPGRTAQRGSVSGGAAQDIRSPPTTTKRHDGPLAGSAPTEGHQVTFGSGYAS
ncbi:hypothetical protein NDU88_002110 [Pleurodeles waltl]|uniref:Uncharacterized protein n=1 Tax=Pleurodeles waltl TaxID=8319 RepID=A0AAV7WKB3_PLEWA|nr:hypothetical protein NDU88_002110 [Pleurodeles waltl]